MKALIRYYLEKSWQPLVGLVILTLLKILGMVYLPFFSHIEGLIIAFGFWFLYKWNVDETKTGDTYYSATVAPSLKELFLVKTVVPALIIWLPVLIASWESSLSSISFLAIFKALLVSSSLVAPTVMVSKPWRMGIALVVIYIVTNDFQDKNILLNLMVFIILNFFSIKTIFGERISIRKLKLATIAALVLSVLFAHKIDDFNWSMNSEEITFSTQSPKKQSFSVQLDNFSSDEDAMDDLENATSEADLEDRISLIQKFQNASDSTRHKILKEMRHAEIVPSPDVIIAFEDAVFARLSAKGGNDKDIKPECKKVCNELSQYAGRYYYKNTNNEIKTRYLEFLKSDEDSAKREYLYNLAANAKIFHHIDSVKEKLEDNENPLTGARVILNEVSESLKSLEGLGEKEKITNKEIDLVVKRELELEAI